MLIGIVALAAGILAGWFVLPILVKKYGPLS